MGKNRLNRFLKHPVPPGVLIAAQGPIVAALAAANGKGWLILCVLFAGAGATSTYFFMRQKCPAGVRAMIQTIAWGNIGMLAGWWVDAGFQPLVGGTSISCGCAAAGSWLGAMLTFQWMHFGMLPGCLLPCIPNLREGRRGILESLLCLSLMYVGMITGGWLAECLKIEPPFYAFLASFFGMSLGMLAGPLLAHRILEIFQQPIRTIPYEQSYH